LPSELRGASWQMPTEVGLNLPQPHSYGFPSEGVVLDTVTQLYWERSVSSRAFHTWQSAHTACEQLELGGFDDWRLPSRIELVSIISLDQLNPAIDRTAFPDTASDWYWTSTPDVSDDAKAWFVYFYFGYPNVGKKSSAFSVRCVRSDAERPPPAERYQLSADAVVDVMTGLEWQRAVPDGLLPLVEARHYCETLQLAGAKPWRAPTMQELQTLVDPRYSAPAIDPVAFPATPPASFWTLTPWVEAPDLRGWHVNFEKGNALYVLGTTPFNIRCVRR